jgi:S-adenosylmethionine synthetase
MKKTYFTSESVTEGHPDKICDQIADSILDSLLKEDPMSRVACEVTAVDNKINIMGEVTSKALIDYEDITREVIRDIGYDKEEYGFDANTISINCDIRNQSPDIALGVDHSLESKENNSKCNDTGAGDQGMMFGYACNETPDLMPLPITLAHSLVKQLTTVRKNGQIPYLRPDGKSQVTVEYHDNVPIRVDTVVISAQHNPEISMEQLRKDIVEYVIKDSIPLNLLDKRTKYIINPTGRFVLGGPACDSGLTGRKIIVDTYGGYAKHGGGAFSGKDCTKVDRSGAYMARYMAKNIVAAGLAEKCEVELSYAIGVAKPVSVLIETYGTEIIPSEKISEIILEEVDLRPDAIIDLFELRKPIYSNTAVYGHFGQYARTMPWEKIDCNMQERIKLNYILRR